MKDNGVPEALTTADLRSRAGDAHRAGRMAEARAHYAAYLAQVPGDAPIWSNLGALLRSESWHDLALAAQERAHALTPDSTVIANNLANILSDLGQYDRAISLRRGILGKEPADANQKAMIGKALRGQGNYAEAIAYLTEAIAEHPDQTKLRMQLALSLLADRRYVEGFRNYDIRWETGELKARQMTRPKWDGGALDGQRILVMPEQGFGDAVAFARFLPVLRQFKPARVLFYTEKPLQRLLDGLDGADWTGSQSPPEEFDVWTNLMDLCALGFEASDAVPPPIRLNLPAESIERARAIAAPHQDRFKVGVVWCGSVTYRGNAFRSFSHREFYNLLDIPGLQFFSLYKGPELAPYLADGSSALIIDTAGTDRDFADCAATMQEMDLIITSDTATAHIAGSLGVPIWTLLHWDAFWLWQHEGTLTPWYPSMRLFRQRTPRDWAGLFARLHPKLSGRVAEWQKART